MRMMVHHAIQRVHRFVDGPMPPPEILILSVWHGDPLKWKRSTGFPLIVSASKGAWHHDYYRRQPELRGDTCPEYDFVLSRRVHTSNGIPPHVQGLTLGPYRSQEDNARQNQRRREKRQRGQ